MKYVKTFEQYSTDINEGWFSKPLTDEEINKYLTSHPTRKMLLKSIQGDEVKKTALMNFLKENPKYVKDDLILQNLSYSDKDGKYVVSSGSNSGNWN
jgi:hypothetical protein